jgi:hypothetical protein
LKPSNSAPHTFQPLLALNVGPNFPISDSFTNITLVPTELRCVSHPAQGFPQKGQRFMMNSLMAIISYLSIKQRRGYASQSFVKDNKVQHGRARKGVRDVQALCAIPEDEQRKLRL